MVQSLYNTKNIHQIPSQSQISHMFYMKLFYIFHK